MYTACLFCAAPLGRNQTLESFPVGRRLAYDAAKGRLWVVCRRCERWNLTPLEERWEAIEQAERLFRGTRLRASTDHVGLARVGDGTELVRIGAALRPEIAAWRYGDQFGRRRTRQLLRTGGLLAAGGAAIAGGLTAGVGGLAAWWMWSALLDVATKGRQGATVARVPMADGRHATVTRRMLAQSALVLDEDGTPGLLVRHAPVSTTASALYDAAETEHTLYTGPDALRVAGRLLPALNRFGGSARDVQHAVSRLESSGGAADYFARVASKAPPVTLAARMADLTSAPDAGLAALPTSARLALEMAAHEEQERRALEGELAELTRAWQEAEEIAAIADDLLLPGGVRAGVERLRGAPRDASSDAASDATG